MKKQTKFKLKVILPINQTAANPIIADVKQEVDAALFPNFTADIEALPDDSDATSFIQSRTSEERNAPEIRKIGKQAEADGYHGIFVSCFAEPGVESLREEVDIPVVGGFYVAAAQTQLLCYKYTIISVVESVLPMISYLGKAEDLDGRITSIRDIGVPVDQLDNHKLVVEKTVAQAKEAIDNEGAECVVLGCTGMLGVVDAVTQQLTDYYTAKKGFDCYVPVVAPTASAITALQSFVMSNKLRPSRLTYYPPTEK